MNFKQAWAAALFTVLLFSPLSRASLAAEESIKVHVTIANQTLKLTQEEITVTDIDGDGALTVHDALWIAHETKYPGGAAAGYTAAEEAYGLCIKKLWGAENGNGYGYYVNHTSVMNLTAPIQNGDDINAFVYTDLEHFSDVYCFFDRPALSATAGESVTLTLCAAGYDENWNPIVTPISNAVILLDGNKTSYRTDQDGKVQFTLDEAKTYIVSAISDSAILVPPVCTLKIHPSAPQTADSLNSFAVPLLCALTVVLFPLIGSKKSNEK